MFNLINVKRRHVINVFFLKKEDDMGIASLYGPLPPHIKDCPERVLIYFWWPSVLLFGFGKEKLSGVSWLIWASLVTHAYAWLVYHSWSFLIYHLCVCVCV